MRILNGNLLPISNETARTWVISVLLVAAPVAAILVMVAAGLR
jgi:hypothetical protein